MKLTAEDISRFWAKVDKNGPDGCWLWIGTTEGHGYGLFDRRREGVRKAWRAHRLSYELTHGALAADDCVLHRCDTPRCVNPAHLFLGDRKANAVDMAAKGRSGPQTQPEKYAGENHWTRRRPERIPRGTGHKNARLTEDAVRDIRRLYGTGLHKQGDLAVRFGVAKATVQAICSGRLWSHVSRH